VSKEELEEAFHLLAQRGGVLLYQEWFESLNKDHVQYFSQSIHTASRDKLTESTPKHHNQTDVRESRQESYGDYNAYKVKDDKVQSACIKFENYMRSQDLSLGVLFAILDTNSNNALTFSEFRSKVHQLEMRLDEEEIMALFKSLDGNGNQSITYDELIDKFSTLNNQQLIKRISKFIIGGKNSPDFVFDKYCKDVTRGKMVTSDFTAMVKDFVKRISNAEVHHMFRHFDRGSKGFITRNDFVAAFTTEVKEQSFQIQIEDIIKPLATKIKKFNVNIGDLFEKADRDKNYQISAQEMAEAISNSSGGKIKLELVEIKLIDDYFLNRFNHKQLTRAEFIELMSTKFNNKHDEGEARKSLATLKQKCDNMKINIQKHLMEHNAEKAERVNLRSFKLAVHDLKCLTLY